MSCRLPKLSSIGVTRVGNLTDLDLIGLPVWFACRPNSFGLSVTQGKGLTHEEAKISAIMEAAEHHHAERAHKLPGSFSAPYSEVRDQAFPAVDLPGYISDSFSEVRERAWCQGQNLFDGSFCLAPYEAIGLDFRLEQNWDRASFQFSTVGLAAGATRDDAILHGALELIENDATILIDALGQLSGLATPVRIPFGMKADLDTAIDRVVSAGLRVEFFAVEHPTEVPVIVAEIVSRETVPLGSSRCYSGYACRLDPATAAIAALLEAVQSRLTDIAGAREDIDYPKTTFSRPYLESNQSETAPSLFDFCKPLSPDESGSKENMEVILARIGEISAGQVYCFDLTDREHDYSVVRVLCPELGHSREGGAIKLGKHGIRALLRRQVGSK